RDRAPARCRPGQGRYRRPQEYAAMRISEEQIAIRVTPEWRDWLDRFSQSERRNRALMIEMGLARLAQAVGFEAPPPRMGENKRGKEAVPPIGHEPGDGDLPAR